MLSVTQREKTPLALGQHVLVIMGPQARVVPDYSMAQEPAASPEPAKEKTDAKPERPVKVEVVLSLPPGMSVQSAVAAPVAHAAPEVGIVNPLSESTALYGQESASLPVAAAAEPAPAPPNAAHVDIGADESHGEKASDETSTVGN
jgi:outer membrane lipoprotein SlyB